MRQRRQSLLLEWILAGDLESQQQAVTRLNDQGIDATQTTVSRDFAALGAVRVHEGDTYKYVIHHDKASHGASLEKAFREYVLRASHSANLLVIHTPPGHAGVVASAIDRAVPPGVLGVIAGDDTIFVCCAEGWHPSEVILYLRSGVSREPMN
jgi:transcriptional regulator of arginine metabolism